MSTDEKPVNKSGSLAFEVILKPASNESPLRPASPPKNCRSSEEYIKFKLEKAQERRQSLEALRLEHLAKEREKVQEALAKAIQENEKFSQNTQQKLRRSMELNKENREAQIKALQERLKNHTNRVEEARQASKNTSKMCFEKLELKMENAVHNKEEQQRALQERLQEHMKRVEAVQKKKILLRKEENETGDA